MPIYEQSYLNSNKLQFMICYIIFKISIEENFIDFFSFSILFILSTSVVYVYVKFVSMHKRK